MNQSNTQRSTTYVLIGLAAIALILVAVWFNGAGSSSGKVDATLIGQGIQAYRVVQDGEPTPMANVYVPFTADSRDYAYANVAIDLNRDGSFAAYQTADGETQEEWVVRNGYAKVITAGNDYSFELVDRGVDAATDMPLEAVLSTEAMTAFGQVKGKTARTKVAIAAFATDDFGPLVSYDRKADRGNDMAGAAAAPEKPNAGAKATTASKVPNAEKYLRDVSADDVAGAEPAPAIGAEPAAAAGGVPLDGSDFEVFQPGVPDMVQGRNECAPTSASNGITGLAQRYGFEDRLPETQRETMQELKTDMAWEANGVRTRTHFIPGKVAFTQRHDLPIYTHQIGEEFDDNIVRKIAAELAKGQAVEVVIGYYFVNDRNEWERNGGHVVSAVGAFGRDGQTFLGVHDPLSADAGRLDMYNVSKTRMYDYRYRGRYAVFVERAFAQSVTQEWIKDHPPKTALDTRGLVEAADFRDTLLVDAIRIGDGWYPVKQFYAFTGPECDGAEHWHATARTAYGVDRKGFQPWELLRPETVFRAHNDILTWHDPDGCGAGKTAEVSRDMILISADESGKLVGALTK